MEKVKGKKEIIEKIKAYNLAFEDTYIENNEKFYIICDVVIINDMHIRDVRKIHFNGDTMWINDSISIDVFDVKEIYIAFTSINYNKKNFKITYE